jgi:hypothetical protein
MDLLIKTKANGGVMAPDANDRGMILCRAVARGIDQTYGTVVCMKRYGARMVVDLEKLEAIDAETNPHVKYVWWFN